MVAGVYDEALTLNRCVKRTTNGGIVRIGGLNGNKCDYPAGNSRSGAKTMLTGWV